MPYMESIHEAPRERNYVSTVDWKSNHNLAPGLLLEGSRSQIAIGLVWNGQSQGRRATMLRWSLWSRDLEGERQLAL